LLRGRQSRKDRRIQPGADGSARRSHRRGQLAVARCGAGQRRPNRITRRSGGLAMTGRIFTRIVATAGIAAVGLTWSAAAQAQEFGSPELIAAAKAEGKLVYYTANFAEV